MQPSDYEQIMLTLINDARADPEGAADRAGIDLNADLSPGEISPEPKQPLAFNPELIEAARVHSDWMLENEMFQHDWTDGTVPRDRIEEAGYALEPGSAWAENISYTEATRPFPDLAEVVEDQHEGLLRSPEHRVNTLTGDFREAGVGLREVGPGEEESDAHALAGTIKFAVSGDDLFLTGTVYRDEDGSGTYSPGEGLGGVSVETEAGSTTTWDSGGYALSLEPGTHEITFSGGELEEPYTESVTIDDVNVLLDVVDGAGEPADEPAENPVERDDSSTGSGAGSSGAQNSGAGRDPWDLLVVSRDGLDGGDEPLDLSQYGHLTGHTVQPEARPLGPLFTGDEGPGG